ncbi:MAG: hypothetical protein A3H79_03170 [Candidatus Levybacteria bacterium RIFCSPLOWO2_02_FULL_36_8b]|nr:MAG: hypothetical protein A3H79_03170 [Candidatus Levybacteria bacterium RIFCSPLOWO2_02_FULL_36_8b]
MNKLTGIVVAKNEEKMIGECLDSLSFCEKILVIDAKSSDRTVEIAKKKGVEVVEYASDDFSAMRNEALRHVTTEWVLYIDADERITPDLSFIIKNQVERENIFAAYRLKRKNFYLGNHEWPYIERLERLFKKNLLVEWKGVLHESPVVKGRIGELDGFLLHYTHRDLGSMVAKTIEWSKVEAELRFESNHPKMSAWRFFRVILTAFFNSYIKQRGWKVGAMGLIESIYQAFSIFITYARLWELQEREKRK